MTTNRNDPKLREIIQDGPRKGQQADYLVLSDDERAKGFVRHVRWSYKHLACGGVTTMGQAIAETYARNPKFYSGTFCCNCGTHFPLIARCCGLCSDMGGKWLNGSWQECNRCFGKRETVVTAPAFLWADDGEPVGSNAEEAAEWNAEKQRREAEKTQGAGI